MSGKENSGAGPTLSAAERRQFIDNGYVVVRDLIPPDVVAATRRKLLEALRIDANDPATWESKSVPSDPVVIALTEPCRTAGVEAVAAQLAGPHFVRARSFSPYLEARGIDPPVISGFIPVLNFPTPGPRQFVRPGSYHIDGMHRTTLWPEKHFLVVFAYLTDTTEYGGATAILPGSHRQVFAHWLRQNHPGSTNPPDLPYADPVPLPGRAGDVIFMHYLAVHSGSANHSDHIRVGLNTAILPDPEHPYLLREGVPQSGWTPLDWTLRTDNLP